MRDLSLKKMTTIAVREFRSTALTKAFLFGAVIFPIVIWAILIAVSAINFEKPPLKGTLVVADASEGGAVAAALEKAFDLEEARRRAEADARAAEQAIKAGTDKMPIAVSEAGMQTAMNLMGIGIPAEVIIETIAPGSDMAAQRQRALRDEVLAVVRVTENSLKDRPPPETGPDGKPLKAQPSADPEGPGAFEFVQGTKLRPDHADELRSIISAVIQTQRFKRAGIDPEAVARLQASRPRAESIVVTSKGEQKSNDNVGRILPFAFMMLIYVATITGGQYLMMGTLEEKSSRVMEVILSAVSPKEILLGKLVGQGLVGLAVLAIYGAVGLAVARRFDALQSIPMNILPWAVVFFIMAYAFLGSLMLAVGSAVTEIREAQALYTPITISIILPFLLIMPIMQNPSSLLARIASFFPPTTPYAMVMRLSQPSVPVPLWELIATAVVGFIGVGVVVWAAAKIFRVGVLMYGKPPSLMGLIKWIRYA